ncbi:peptide chain release factor N(5)-glutamine methyltransferase [uncultured Piscinibacter sp.]|uniref:peptide chain release factor N(5)-glutamine methyltransferase n=1 Tax=uncultured Piscinibacter sp. TaxID=1131835 RepID=UPI0026165249|nr:peptide chain release factor N(5)-glutamine methyltransferase [uncultured Piscinibacter sp.]
MSTLRDVLAAARARGLERLDAQLLLAHVLGCNRAWLLAHDDRDIASEQAARFEQLVARRAAGEPFAYIVGGKEFHGLSLQVDERVLVPRPDTEVLADWAIELLRGELSDTERPEVVDLGTGSGAIALAVSRACPTAHVTATDASPEALEVARANAASLGLPIDTACGSWWDAVPGLRVHLALSNPPYIAAGDPHLAALHAEPRAALTPGETGLESLRQIVAGAAAHLQPRAWLLLEHGFDQADAVRSLLHVRGFSRVNTRHDLAGRARCSGGCLDLPAAACRGATSS